MEVSSRVALQDTFFSANIKYYEFSPNYEQKSTFKDVLVIVILSIIIVKRPI